MACFENAQPRRLLRLLIFLFATSLFTACGEKSVASTENEFEANTMFDILFSSGLNVEKVAKQGEKPGWEIVIDEGWFGEGEAAAAMQVLNDHGLPRVREPLPAAAGPYGVTSPEEVKKRQNREKEIQLEDHLYSLPGVTGVNVVIAQPANDILSLDKTPPTASVLVVQKEMPPKFTHADVQTYVSGSVPNLKPENVRVTVTYQPLREVPLERLRNQQRTRTIVAVSIALILLLGAALLVIRFLLKRRRRATGSTLPQLPGDDSPEIEGAEQFALRGGEKEALIK